MNEQVERYLALLQKDPANEPAFHFLEEVFLLKKNWQELLHLYEGQTLREISEEKKGELYFKMGQIHNKELSQPDEAIRYFEQTCQTNAEHRQALENLLSLLLDKKQFTKALQICEMLESILINDRKEHWQILQQMLAIYREGLKTPDLAFDIVERMLQIDPTQREMLYSFQNANISPALWKNLLENIESWIVSTGEIRHRENYLLLKSWILEEIFSQSDEAVQILNRIAEKSVAIQRDKKQALSRIFGKKGDVHAQIEILQDLVGLTTVPQERLLLWKQMAHLYQEKLGDSDRALATWRKVFEQLPEDPESFQSLSLGYRNLRDWRSLVDLLAKHIHHCQDDKTKIEHFFEMGEVFREHLRQGEKAIRCYERVLQGEPRHFGSARALLLLYGNLSAQEQLRKLVEKLTYRARRGDLEAELLLALHQAQSSYEIDKNLDQSLVSYQAILTKHPQLSEPVTAIKQILQQKQAWTDLIQFLESRLPLLTSVRDKSEHYFQIALLYLHKLKNDSVAIVFFKKAMTEDPSHQVCAQILEGIFRKRENWGDLLHLLLKQIEGATSDAELIRLSREAGGIWEEKFQDKEKAYEMYFQIFQRENKIVGKKNVENLRSLRRLAAELKKVKEFIEFLEIEINQTHDSLLVKGFLNEGVHILQIHCPEDIPLQSSYLKRILAIDPVDVKAIGSLEKIYQEQNNFVELSRLFEQALANVSTPSLRAPLEMRLAGVLEEIPARRNEALGRWESARKMEPSHLVPLRALYRLYQESSRWQEFRDIALQLERLLKQEKEPSEWLKTIEDMAQHLERDVGDPQAASEALEKLYRYRKERGEPVQATLKSLERILRDLGDWSGYAEILDRELGIVQVPSERVKLYNELGRVQIDHLNRSEHGVACLEKSLEIEINQPDVFEKVIWFYESTGNYEKAQFLLEQSLSKSTFSPAIRHKHLIHLAEILSEQLNRVPDAAKVLQAVVREDAENEIALKRLNSLYEKTHDSAMQRKVLENLHALYEKRGQIKEDIQILENLLALQKDEKDFDKAVVFAETLLQRVPDHFLAFQVLEVHFRSQKAFEKLLQILLKKRNVFRGKEEEKDILLSLAEVAQKNLGDRSRSVQILEEILGLHSLVITQADGLWLKDLMKVYEDREDWSRFCQTGERLLQIPNEQSVEVYQKIAKAFDLYLKNREASLRNYYGAAKLIFSASEKIVTQELREEILTPLMLLLEEFEKWQELAELFEWLGSAVQDKKEKAAFLIQAGEIFLAKGQNLARGEKNLKQGLTLDPGHENAFRKLEKLYRARQDWKNLIAIYELRAEEIVNISEVTSLLVQSGRIWEDQLNDQGEASLCYKRAIEIAPADFNDMDFVDRLQKIYQSQKNWIGIAHLLERKCLLTRDTDKIELLFQLAYLYEEEWPQWEKAYATYQRVLEVQESHKGAVQALSRLAIEHENWPEAVRHLSKLVDVTKVGESDHDYLDRVRYLEHIGEIYQFHLSEPDKAIVAFEEILSIDPSSINALRHLHRLYAGLENWPKLAEVYEAILVLVRTSEEKVKISAQLGELYAHRLGDSEKAIFHLRQVLVLDPGQSQAFRNLCEMLRTRGQFEDLVEVERAFLKTVTDAQEGYDIIEDIAQIYDEHLDQSEEAVSYYFKLAEGRNDALALQRISVLLKDTDQLTQLERAYRLLLDLDRPLLERMETKVSLARLLMETMNLKDEAVEILEEVVQEGSSVASEPNRDQVLYEAAVMLIPYLDQSQDDDEVKTQRLHQLYLLAIQCAQDSPQEMGLLNRFAMLEERLDNMTAAQQSFERALELARDEAGDYSEISEIPEIMATLSGLSRGYSIQGDWPKLRQVYQDLIKIAPDPSPWHFNLGSLILEHFPGLAETRTALEHLEEAIVQNPLHLEVRKTLNQALESLSMWSRWLDSVGAEISLEPDILRRADLLERRASILDEIVQKPLEAIEALKESLALHPEFHQARNYLVALLLQQEKVEEALSVLLEGLDSHEDTYDLQTLLCEAARITWTYLQDNRRGLDYFERSLSLMNSHQPHITTSRLSFGMKEFQSQEIYSMYKRHYGEKESGEFFIRYAKALGETKNTLGERITLLEKAVSLEPGNKEARLSLCRLLFEQENFEKAFEICQEILEHSRLTKEDPERLEILEIFALSTVRLNRIEDLSRAVVELLPWQKVQDDLFETLLTALKDQSFWPPLRNAFSAILQREECRRNVATPLLAVLSYLLGLMGRKEGMATEEIISRFRFVAEALSGSSVFKKCCLVWLGEDLERLGHRREAIQVYEAVFQNGNNTRKENDEFLEKWLAVLPEDLQPVAPDEDSLHLKLGEMLEGSDEQEAAKHYWAYLSKHPGNHDLVEKLSAWFENWHDFEKLEKLLDLALGYAMSLDRVDDKWAKKGLHRLAAVRLRELANSSAAIEAFEKVLSLDSEDEEAHVALSTLYAQDSRKIDLCIHEHEWLLQKDPLRTESYRVLVNVYREKGEEHKSAHLAGILVLLGKASREEKDLSVTFMNEEKSSPAGSISEEMRRALLVHPRQKVYLEELFHLMKGGLEKVYRFRPEKLNIQKSDRLDGYSPPAIAALWRRANQWYRAFGGKELRIYWDRQSQNRLLLENDKIPALIMSSDFLPSFSDQEQDFLIGRFLQYMLDDFIVLQKIRPQELENTLLALLKIIDPETTVVVAQEDLEVTEKTASKLSRKVRKDLRPLLNRHINPDTKVILKDWLWALRATANRGGLLCCGSIQVACEMLAREKDYHTDQGPEALTKIIRKSKTILDLLSFAASSNYFTLRNLLLHST